MLYFEGVTPDDEVIKFHFDRIVSILYEMWLDIGVVEPVPIAQLSPLADTGWWILDYVDTSYISIPKPETKKVIIEEYKIR